jgi:hypothetical protein
MTVRLLLSNALLLASSAVLAQDITNPNSREFDPVAHMQRFFPGWQPPTVSQEELSKHLLGSAERPVRAQGPQGQHDYLSRLVCRNGKTPKFHRVGSIGDSPYGYPMDAYEVKCGWSSQQLVYMDLYHPRYIEQEPIRDFTLRD